MTAAGREKIAGVLGGMGPEATADLLLRIIRHTPAKDDADHVRCVIDNNPKVPSRIKALIEGRGEDPAPVLEEMARKLEAWGADFLCIPCNTAHNYYPQVAAAVSIPVLNMVELSADAARAFPGSPEGVGILASPAVRMTALYTKALSARGLTALYPEPDVEEALLNAIKAVKQGESGLMPRTALRKAVDNLAALGAGLCVVACTELGIILEGEYPVPVIDAADVLARAVVCTAKQ